MKCIELKRQDGLTLLLFLIVIIGIAAVLGVEFLNQKVESVTKNKFEHDQRVLRQAKRALLAYAVEYSISADLTEAGKLPCPDMFFLGNPEGTQDPTCGVTHANASGFLPWKTLGIETLRGSSGDCLWYVVSGDYKSGSTSAGMLNEDSNGLLKVQDENGKVFHPDNPGGRPIALIIAPGGVLGSQGRSPANASMVHCKGNYTEANYLESGGSVIYATDHVNTADEIWTFVNGSQESRLENQAFNDRIVWISKDEYWNEVKRLGDLESSNPIPTTDLELLTDALAQCIVNYGNSGGNEQKWLPWPAALNLGITADYRDDSDYIDQSVTSDRIGRLPRNISNSDIAESLATAGTDTTYYLDTSDIFFTPIPDGTLPDGCLSVPEFALWIQWKDHFFYAVADDFVMAGATTPLNTRCGGSNDCLEIDGGTDDLSAIVLFSGSVVGIQSRNAKPVDGDEKDDLSNYLESENADLDELYDERLGDYLRCVQFSTGAGTHSIVDCR